MSVITNKQLCLYTVGLLIVWIIVLTTATSNLVVPSAENIENEKSNTRNCKALCDHCACLGFYCGEECICECNNENSDTECIARMQENARRLKIPFELLIQGPSANNFVHNALEFEQNHEKRSSTKKRPTVTIYKPLESGGGIAIKLKLDKSLRSANEVNDLNEKMAGRPKRGTPNKFEWFSDLTHNLVKPAPLGGRNKNSDESKTSPTHDMPTKPTKSRTSLDRSWFMDTIPKILTPAPLSKRQGSSSYQARHHDEDDDDASDHNANKASSTQSPERGVYPQQRKKDNFRDLRKDIANAFGVKVMKKPSGDDLDNKFFGKKYRNILDTVDGNDNANDDLDSKLDETLDELNKQRRNRHPSEFGWDLRRNPYKEDEGPELRMPWWRPARFFKRVQYVLNPLT